jgi:hypothetical protein
LEIKGRKKEKKGEYKVPCTEKKKLSVRGKKVQGIGGGHFARPFWPIN